MFERLKGQMGRYFYSRWSRRRRKPGKAPAPEAVSGVTDEYAAPDTNPLVDAPAALPPIETLDESSDYSGFLSPEVDEELQRLALRKLFGSSRFNLRDGLDDYDEDYRSFEALGDTLTADLRHRLGREAGEALAPDTPLELPATAQADAPQEGSAEMPDAPPSGRDHSQDT